VGIYKKGPYYTECGEMTDGCWLQKVRFGIVCISRGSVENFFVFFPRTEMWAFSETDFWITDQIHLIDWIWSVKCTCMVCLCKYHNWVTQGVGRLLNVVGPTPTRRYHGWHRAGKFWKFRVSRSLEMAFSESLLFVIIEIRTLDMVFKFKNFFDPPFFCIKTFFTPLFIRVKLRLPPSHLPTPSP
jgi:hypothetical protein